jgi:DUF4097 and DUF4098 domain-containing protein YvlB
MPINLKTTSLVGGSLIVLGLALGYAGYKGGAVTAMSWEGGPHLVKTETKTVSFSATELKKLDVQANNYAIDLDNKVASDKATVTMTYDENAKPTVVMDKETLKVDAKESASNNFGIGFFDGAKANKITISLPDHVYSDLKVITGNGAIKSSGIDAKSATIESNNGAISIVDGKLSSLSISADNGAFTGQELTSDSMTVDMDNGAMKLTDASFGQLSGTLNNGAIKATDITITDGGKLSTRNGMMVFTNLTVPSITASTTNGAVKVSGKKIGRQYKKIEEGKTPFELQTNNGAIEIN